MKAKRKITPVLVFSFTIAVVAAAAVFFIAPSTSVNESSQHSVDKSLVSGISASQSKTTKETDVQQSSANTSARENVPPTSSSTSSRNLEDLYRLVSSNDDYPTLASRVNAIKARRPNLEISPDAVLAALEKSESWETTQGPLTNVIQKLDVEQLNDGRSFIKFDPIKVETLMPGDHMHVAIDALGTAYDMEIDEVENFYDGNLMWRGSLVNVDGTEAEGGTVTITQSSKVTVASVVLREKDYTLESYGTDGWIARSTALFKVNPNRSDAIVPENER